MGVMRPQSRTVANNSATSPFLLSSPCFVIDPAGRGAALPAHGRARSHPAGAVQTKRETHLAEPTVGIKELLEAGVHFGHQTRRWNPKMRRFIFGERDGIHIIDLQKTERLLTQAREFAANLAARGGTVLFVGTKKQARDTVEEAAKKSG